jgi:hypothetical protein
VHISSFIHPAVVLEHSAFVKSTECNADSSTITVSFNTHAAWATAVEDWKQHSKFLLVAFADSCGRGRESGERSAHVLHNITTSAAKLQIVGQMVELPLIEVIHPDRKVEINMDTFDRGSTNQPPSVRIRRQDGDNATSSAEDSGESFPTSTLRTPTTRVRYI